MLHDDVVTVHAGEMFGGAAPTGQTLDVASVTLLAPCRPTKIVGLWNNLRAAADKNGWAVPDQPLWFIKPASCVQNPGGPIVAPRSHAGRVVYEGELGVVIGRRGRDIAPDAVDDHVFGYTCVNDVTGLELLFEDPAFPQWCRAKSFDTFGPLGPVIARGVEPDELVVHTLVNGRVRQDYPIADMIFSPRALVSLVSRDLTLEPGDVIACGTSTGVLPLKPGTVVEVAIEGIGVLRNEYVDSAGEVAAPRATSAAGR